MYYKINNINLLIRWSELYLKLLIAIFYLRARGIGELAAKKLMVEAFIGEVYERMEA